MIFLLALQVVATAAAVCPDSTAPHFRAILGGAPVQFAVSLTLTDRLGHPVAVPPTAWSVKPATSGRVDSMGRYTPLRAGWPVVVQARVGPSLYLHCVRNYPKGATP